MFQSPISSAHYQHLSLSHSSCEGKARLAPSLRTTAHSRRYAPPLPSRAPGPPRQTLSPSLSGAPFRSPRLVGHATHPLSLPPGFTKPPTHLRDIRSAPALKVGTPFISGGHSFRREEAPSPGTPLPPWLGPARSAHFLVPRCFISL